MATCPVRCYECNKVLGNKYRTYWNRRDNLFAEYLSLYDDPAEAEARARREASCSFPSVTRDCCKKMLMTSVDLTPLLLRRRDVELRNSEFKARKPGLTTIILGRGTEPPRIFQGGEVPKLLPSKRDSGLAAAMDDMHIDA